jgi:hypothetical protein
MGEFNRIMCQRGKGPIDRQRKLQAERQVRVPASIMNVIHRDLVRARRQERE